MYRQIIPILLVILGLAQADTGFAASIQRAAPPVIASTTVDADKDIMVVSGHHFGKEPAVVALGNRVLKVKRHSDHEVVVELPAGLPYGSYLLTVTSSGYSKQTSEPFNAAVFAAR
jgi:hypothetical protein